MKKIACTLFLILLLTVTASASHVFDGEGILTADETSRLEGMLQSASYETGYSILVVTDADFDGKAAYQYADDFFDFGDFGEDGIVFLLSLTQREWYISTSGDAIYAYSDDVLEYFEGEIVYYLSSNQFYSAFARFSELCCQEYENYVNGVYYGEKEVEAEVGVSSFFAPVVFGFIVGLITVSVMKGQLKSVRPKSNAGDYVKNGSFSLNESRDVFLWRNVTRVRRQSSSSSSGGSRSSSTHRSSSGRSHGGRGGKF